MDQRPSNTAAIAETAGDLQLRAATPASATIASPLPRSRQRSTRISLLLLFWVLILFDPHLWAVELGLVPLGSLPTVICAVLVLLILSPLPTRGWAPPMLCYLVFITVTMPLAVNRGSAYVPIKAMVVFCVLAVATLAWIKDYRQARPIILMLFLGQFVWWGTLGLGHGEVDWHPNLSNYDSYGPMMVIGIGLSFYFALATKNRRLRRFAFATAAVCVAGVVASFARGAALGAVAVLFYIWLRWPQKARATLALAGAAAVVMIMASFLTQQARGGDSDSPQGFWNEMSTISKETDAANGGSSNERRMLWATAVKVFKDYPIMGAGAGNFGPAASGLPLEAFQEWDIDNPHKLWEKALHSSYYQVLSEGGLIGCFLYLWLLADFVRRNLALRSRRALQHWETTTGGEFDLRYLSWGLEAGMIGFLATAVFYNQLYIHWLYTLFIMNTLLHQLSRPLPATARAGAR